MKLKQPAIIVFLTILFPVILASSLIGQTIKEERPVKMFDQVSLTGIGTVILTQDKPTMLLVEADKDLLPEIKTEVRGSTLYLGLKDHTWWKSHWLGAYKDIHYFVTLPKVRGISVSGSGSIEADKIESRKLRISISGSGEIEIGTLEAGNLDVSISGSGDCRLVGQVEDQKISISGSGTYDAHDLQSDETEIRISGSGNATVWVERDIDVKVSGSGTVKYVGDPKDVSFQSSGSGKVLKIGHND